MTCVKWKTESISSSVGTRLYSSCSATAIFALSSRSFFSLVFITSLVSQNPSQKSSKNPFRRIWGIAFSIELSYPVRVRTCKRGGVTMTKQEEPISRIVKATEARDRLPQLLNSVYRGEGRVVVERSGIPVAAIVSPQDLAALDRLDAQRAELADVLAEMRKAFKDVPQEEIEEETNKAVAEVRAQMRAEREQAAKAPSTP